MNKQAIIEGLLFLSGDEGISVSQIIHSLNDNSSKEDIENILADMMQEYMSDHHGIELVFFGDLYKFISKASIHEYAKRMFSETKIATLSQAALETLAIIAYKQPITRVEIEEIRGVGCDMMIRKLLARSLIQESGRSEAPGRPFLYQVTTEFLDSFKLESLKELPELPEFHEQIEEDLFEEI